MKHGMNRLAALRACGMCVFLLLSVAAVHADLITDNDIVALTTKVVGSGNGTLDFVILTDSEAQSKENSYGSFDADDAFTEMPKGAGSKGGDALESYITSIGEIRQFYSHFWPDGHGGSTENEIVLLIDINQAQDVIHLDNLTVVSGYDLIFGDARDNPAGNDIDPDTQGLTEANFTGGVLLASLDNSPKLLPLTQQGAGFADYAIFLGINPFDSTFSDNTPILFHWRSSGHDAGGESVFLGSPNAPQEAHTPEPATLSLLALGILTLLRRRRR